MEFLFKNFGSVYVPLLLLFFFHFISGRNWTVIVLYLVPVGHSLCLHLTSSGTKTAPCRSRCSVPYLPYSLWVAILLEVGFWSKHILRTTMKRVICNLKGNDCSTWLGGCAFFVDSFFFVFLNNFTVVHKNKIKYGNTKVRDYWFLLLFWQTSCEAC